MVFCYEAATANSPQRQLGELAMLSPRSRLVFVLFVNHRLTPTATRFHPVRSYLANLCFASYQFANW